MRLVIDLQCLQTSSRYRGIGHYVSSLVEALIECNQNQAEPHELILLFNGAQLERLEEQYRRWASLAGAGSIRVFQSLPGTAEVHCPNQGIIRVSEYLRNDFIERLAPDFVLIGSLFEGMTDEFVASIPSVRRYAVGVIGYDLIPLISPREYLGDPLIRQWYYRKLESLHRADRIFAISESASREFETQLAPAEGVVHTISTACDSGYYPLADAGEPYRDVLAGLGVDGPFILYSGAPDERKNLNALLQAFSQLEYEQRQHLRLVLVGRFEPVNRAAISQFARRNGIPDEHVVYTGFIPQHELNVLYNHCEVFVFPSRHEGFGLPVLEAMTCGAPVLCANTTSLPEVMGWEEAMFAPDDIPRLTALITRVLTEPGFRQRLIDHGLQRAQLFCWKRTAQALLREAEQVVAGQSPAPAAGATEQTSDRLPALARLCASWQLPDTSLRQLANSLAANERAAGEQRPQQHYHWRIEGPFDSSYSLALLNRETARGLAAIGQTVTLHSTEGPGDFEPDPEFMAQNPDIGVMHARLGNPELTPDITSRNLYPPRVDDIATGHALLHHYAWEESGFPQAWAEQFSQHLTGLTCLSEHVRKVLIDNGVCLPMAVSGCGVDHWDRVAPEPYAAPGDGFRFLHVSSCFPRKGVDALLAAWGQAFTHEDNACLIIKTFPNPHNDVVQQLAAHREANPAYPEVILIWEDLPAGQLKSLYEQCHALVAPSRAEGFGLPLAEAMLSGLPVITTGWSGQLDFCDPQTTWLTRYRFGRARTHFNLPDSVWANPDTEHLASQMRAVHETPAEQRQALADAAAAHLREHFSWERVALRMVNQAERIIRIQEQAPTQRALRIGWVSTWNQRCGLATYSRHLIEQNTDDDIRVYAPVLGEPPEQPDGANVTRCWYQDDQDPLTHLGDCLLSDQVDVVVIQMNIYFYSYPALAQLIARLRSRGIVVTLTLHATIEPEPRKALSELRPAAESCDRVLVHTVGDLNRLVEAGMAANATLLPHGMAQPRPAPVDWPHAGKRCIASYGFALPHKGLEVLLEAFAHRHQQQPDTVLLLLNAEHPDASSAATIQALHRRIQELGLEQAVHTEHRFLSDEHSMALLQQADVIAMPYQNTGESASGAVRMAIASARPVMVTPLPIFEDVAPAVGTFSGTDADAIAHGLERVLAGQDGPEPEQARQWREQHSYPVVAGRLARLLRALWLNR
ncbi:glycosyltransferase [Vreelandella utahensis]|uniref:glycosyltransferase n=1 Tax=Vreelandella halophila TaxID=86177 RepID=UPI0009857247|nr:glycosyltransferase [Halomonas utahensis]